MGRILPMSAFGVGIYEWRHHLGNKLCFWRGRYMKRLALSPEKGITHVIFFCITVVLALALLIGGALLPQQPIADHILESIGDMEKDLADNRILDRSTGSALDVGTDLMILSFSLSTNDRYLGSVLTNPYYWYNGLRSWDEKAEAIARLAYDFPADEFDNYYAKYWLGFRFLVRLALTFFNYSQMKRYMAFMFFGLFTMVLCSVAKHSNTKIAMLFSLSVILVRPHIIATSMQFSCCFIIMFIAMLLIPWLYRNPKWETLFFMEVGMLTMYFDFYTVPLITLGFPLVYLYVLRMERDMPIEGKTIFKDCLAWFLGYGFMWIARMVLTTVLTSVNSLEAGFLSFFQRTGIVVVEDLQEYYSASKAFAGIREAVFSDATGKTVYTVGAVLIVAWIIIRIARGKLHLDKYRYSLFFVLMAVAPLVWFYITKQPIAIHYYFQYRSIALTHWSAGVFFYSLVGRENHLHVYQE